MLITDMKKGGIPVVVSRTKQEVSIQWLLKWAFGTENARLDFGSAAAMAGHDLPHFGTEYVMIERARLGCRVDGGGHSDPHADADVVASVVAALDEGHGGRWMAIAVAEYARAGRVPDWMDGARPRCVPAQWRQHKHGAYAQTELIEVIAYKHRGRKVRREVRCCPVIYTPTPSQIAAARRFYLTWWGALLDLAAALRAYGGLVAYDVSAAMPPLTPWRAERAESSFKCNV